MASTTRPMIVGPDSGPEPPFPLRMEGKVISGFGRGSKELGIPTANIPVDTSKTPWINDLGSGIYFGWASLALPDGHPNKPPPSSPSSPTSSTFTLYPMVMSIGYNPFYHNEVRSAEVHILHPFAADFYGATLRLLLLGFVRDEKNYEGVDALVADIRLDCDVTRNSLARPAWTPRQLLAAGVAGATAGGQLDGSWLVRDEEES